MTAPTVVQDAPQRGGAHAPGTTVGRSARIWWLALPSAIPILLLSVLPVMRGIYLGFTDADSRAGHDIAFTGLANYAAIARDPLFVSALTTGLVWTLIASAIEVGLALGLALLLDQRRPGRHLLLVVAVLPWAVPPVTIAVMWRLVYEPNNGLLNAGLIDVGLADSPHIWMTSGSAYAAVMMAVVWSALPFTTVVLLSSLQGVHGELREAAALDGAGSRATFRHIVWPHIVPGVVLVTSLCLIINFNQFSLVYALTYGSAVGTVRLPMLVAYEEAFRFGNFGYAAALGNVMAVILCALVAGLLWYSARTRVRP